MANLKESELQDNQPSNHPLGATPDENGVNFSIFAERATSVELLLFDEHDDPEPIQTIQLDPYKNKTFHFWHVYVRGIKPGIHYAYRVDGPQDLHGRGDRYNRNKVLRAEWNGRHRDTIRHFVKGDRGYIDGKTMVGRVADVIAGSADIFKPSVNFITAHDGFTLNDLVSYNYKHNEANGEGNRDGSDNNLSWNCGVEGETDDPDIEALRKRQIKNFAAILLLSQGVPMFVAGDEIRRTQKGNNNAYCQDNEISWFDWNLAKKNQEMFRFFKRMIALRKSHPLLQRSRFFTGQPNQRGLADISWHGCRLNSPGWYDPNSSVLGFTMGGFDGDADLHVMLNMDWQNLDFDIPSIERRKWFRAVDTALPSPEDIATAGQEVEISGNTYHVNGRSVVVLLSK